MTTDRQHDESISRWLEETAPRRLPDRVLAATFERTRRTGQHVGWRARLGRLRMTPAVPALGGAAAVVVAAALALNFFSAGQPRVGGPATTADPRILFLDTWLSSDPDGSTLTMTVRASGEAALKIVVLDDLASVCSGASSTMTGTGPLQGPGTFVIPSPDYTCDDGTEPRALSGPPLAEQLRNLTFVHDSHDDVLTDNLGGVWVREGVEPPRRQPAPLAIVWPQTSLEGALEAQRLADAGDTRFTWQLVPLDRSRDMEFFKAEIFTRFLREELGWEAFQGMGGRSSSAEFIRCAPGRTNPLYPDDPAGRACAPTIDEVQYERVELDVAQPVREGPTGVWVVTRWAMAGRFEQAVPPSDAEIAAVLEPFLQARIDGSGAEEYVAVSDPTSPWLEVPLLYATTAGARYERSEFEVVHGPVWPDSWMRVKSRLYADSETIVEQTFDMYPDATGRIRLDYQFNPWDGAAPTTENGQAVPVPYRFPRDEVTFGAAWPWSRDPNEPQAPRLVTLTRYGEPPSYYARLAVVAEPRPIERGCQEGPDPADIDALVRSIQGDPDLTVTAPVAVTVGGLAAVQIDVEQAPGASICDQSAQTVVVTASLVDEYTRMRLYLVELPGTSPRIVTIAVTAPKSDFDRVMEAEAALLESFRFQTQ